MDKVMDVRLQAFEGPLDLLLHLIEKNKIDIYDIPIAEITDQYIEYVRALKEQDPDLASSFLLMAATLLEIKSRTLLPGNDDSDDEEDPRAALIEQLTTYRIYKEAAERLGGMELPDSSFFCREQYLPPEVREFSEPVDVDAVLDDLTLRRLSEIFDELMRRRAESVDPVRSRFGRIRREKLTLAQRMTEVRSYFADKEQVTFTQLLEDTGGGRIGAIMTFLSVLELAKDGFLFLKAVGRRSREIKITRRENAEG